MNKYYYIMPEHMTEAEEFESFMSPEHLEFVVEEIVEIYVDLDSTRYEHFPIDIEIYDQDEQSLGLFEVEIEFTPSYSVSKKDAHKEEV